MRGNQSFRDRLDAIDASIVNMTNITSRVRTILRDRRYSPPPPGVGPRPEYLLHLLKTRGRGDLVEVEVDDV